MNFKNLTFKEQIDYVLENARIDDPSEFLIVRNNTPKILQMVGVPNFPIFMTRRHVITTSQSSGIYVNANYHNLGKRLLYELPKLLELPILIVESLSRPNSIILVTDKVDAENRPVIIALHIGKTAQFNNKMLTVNVLASVYGRNEWDYFIKRIIERNKLLLIDKEKSQHLLVTSGLQLPSCIAKFDSFIIIKKISFNVNIRKTKNK